MQTYDAALTETVTIEDLVVRTQALAPVPTIYFKVRDLIEQPDASVVELARIIAVDPALTARLLSIVNSPIYAQSRPVETISRAVNMLGMQQIHDLVLVTSLYSAFSAFDKIAGEMRAFWDASVRRAALISALVEYDKERLFVLGLLGDLGLPVLLLHQPNLVRHARALAEQTRQPLHGAERMLIGFDHAELGGALLAAWKLPAGIHQPIGHQSHFQGVVPHARETAWLHLASVMVEAVDRGEEPLLWAEPALWAMTGGDAETALAALSGIEADIGKIRSAFFA